MAMSFGGNQGPQMNVTPLIDVLLVLIIIFMLTVVKYPKGLKTLAPPEPNKSAPVTEAEKNDLVVTVLEGRTVQLNQEPPVAIEELGRQLLKNAVRHVIFVRGSKNIDFESVAQVIDIAKGVGVERVALMPR